MDTITQMALGASVFHAAVGRRVGRRAMLAGAVLGTLPDLDVLIPHADAIVAFTVHRGFSHSLFVLSLASLPLAAIAARIVPGRRRALEQGSGSPGFGMWWFATWAALCTHPLLDAFTTYGTQIFWPIPTQPVAIGSIFIIDPLYTLPLLIGLFIAWRAGRKDKRGQRVVLLGLALSSAWLVMTLVLQRVVAAEAWEALAADGTRPDRLLVLPLPFGVLWRTIAIDGDDWLEGWISLADGSDEAVFVRSPRGLDALGRIDDPALSASASRLRWFTGGFFAAREVDGVLVLSDLRIGTNEVPVFAFDVARRSDGNGRPAARAGAAGNAGAASKTGDGDDTATWRSILPEERQPDMDLSVLGRLARRAVDSAVEVDSGRLDGEPIVP